MQSKCLITTFLNGRFNTDMQLTNFNEKKFVCAVQDEHFIQIVNWILFFRMYTLISRRFIQTSRNTTQNNLHDRQYKQTKKKIFNNKLSRKTKLRPLCAYQRGLCCLCIECISCVCYWLKFYRISCICWNRLNKWVSFQSFASFEYILKALS